MPEHAVDNEGSPKVAPSAPHPGPLPASQGEGARSLRVASLPSRLWTALGALGRLARDHTRIDQALVFAHAVNGGALARAVERFVATDEGLALATQKPRIDRSQVDFDALRRLPDGTLGREYTRFLDDNGIGPETFASLPDLGDPQAEWIMLRVRQTHDIWHVLTGYSADVRGEVLLQTFTYAQLRVPSAFLIAFFGSLRWLTVGKQHLREVRHAYRRGLATQPLAAFRWEEHWGKNVSELRELLTCPA